MNVLEALSAALPELPAKRAVQTYPKLDPQVIAREHTEAGQPMILVHMPGSEGFVRTPPDQWALLQLFDGTRSYKEISEIFLEQTGIHYSEDDVRELATLLLDNTEIFYRSPLEKDALLRQKLGKDRKKRSRLAVDPAEITILEWDPDDFLTRFYAKVRFIYTRWFTLVTLAAFAVMVWMWTDRFGEIWIDSFQYYNFAAKNVSDLVEFWFLFGLIAFIHESSHGMTCKHFGGGVKKMGFILMYVAPAFYCDVTQVWIYGTRWPRIATVIAGIWGDLIFCFFCTVIWWGTPTGMWVHDFAYKGMMVSGIGVSLINLNPLIQLDGYYLFSELTGEVDLKEKTTSYVSSWVRKNIWRLPVEVEYVSRRRRAFYLVYTLLSSIYSYGLLVVVVLFLHNVFRSYTPEWAFIPTALVGYLIFKSRIKVLRSFMRIVYLDKKERLRAWLTPRRALITGALTAVVLFAPVWPDFVQCQFFLEPVQRAVIRAEVPGRVQQVYVKEGAVIAAGVPLARLRNLALETEAARSAADLQTAAARATQSQLLYAAYGPAERERQQLAERHRVLAEQVARLEVVSPIAGVVVTQRVSDLTGSYLEEGTTIAEVADFSATRARLHVPEFAMRDLRLGAPVVLLPESSWRWLRGTLDSVAPAPVETEREAEQSSLRGLRPPGYYLATVLVPNDGSLREGMTGTAKIFATRRSLAGFAFRFAHDLVVRRAW